MLKGTIAAIVHGVQPMSIHGQVSLDVYYRPVDDPDGQVRVARIGEEAVPRNLQEGDRIAIDMLLGVATAIRRGE